LQAQIEQRNRHEKKRLTDHAELGTPVGRPGRFAAAG
jgi:hypothetical protein